MTHCKYCGRDDHGTVNCWQKHDHEKMNLEFIRADHCVYCIGQDLDKRKENVTEPEPEPEVEEEIQVCFSKIDMMWYDRHGWVLCDKNVYSNNGRAQNEYLFICPDCEIRKVASYDLR